MFSALPIPCTSRAGMLAATQLCRSQVNGGGASGDASGRQDVLNNNTLLSELTKYKLSSAGHIDVASRRQASLLSQRHVSVNDTRERRFALCRRCGRSTVTIGFDGTPSARLGMFGSCNGSDFTHHQLVPISEADYHHVRPMSTAERKNWVRFVRSYGN